MYTPAVSYVLSTPAELLIFSSSSRRRKTGNFWWNFFYFVFLFVAQFTSFFCWRQRQRRRAKERRRRRISSAVIFSTNVDNFFDRFVLIELSYKSYLPVLRSIVSPDSGADAVVARALRPWKKRSEPRRTKRRNQTGASLRKTLKPLYTRRRTAWKLAGDDFKLPSSRGIRTVNWKILSEISSRDETNWRLFFSADPAPSARLLTIIHLRVDKWRPRRRAGRIVTFYAARASFLISSWRILQS